MGINAINIVSTTDVTFRKGISFEEKVVDFISLWKRGQPCLLSRTFCKQNDVISQSYKLVDNSKMKQIIKKISMTFFIVQQCYSSASMKILASDYI